MEAIYEFEVENMPVTVAVDASGSSVHETGPARWRRRLVQLSGTTGPTEPSGATGPSGPSA
jgi:fumarate hydratase class I